MAVPKERTFIMIKPDAVQRGLIGKIIQRFEKKGFKLVAMKFRQADEERLKLHYADMAGCDFFEELIRYMQLGPVIHMVWEGLNIVKTTRSMIGATNPKDSLPGTIRGDLCVQCAHCGRNVIHGSDSVPNAQREIALWFTEKELMHYTSAVDKWIYEDKNGLKINNCI